MSDVADAAARRSGKGNLIFFSSNGILAWLETSVKRCYNAYMIKYIFILGKTPKLSIAEIKAVVPQLKIIQTDDYYLLGESQRFDCQEILNRLGGTVKIGIYLGPKIAEGPILGAAASKEPGQRFNFGFSFYGAKPAGPGMKIKKLLQEQGIGARLVTSREPVLSSVIVKKEKCQDYLVGSGWFGVTCAVQDFRGYGELDYGRPKADAFSGMLPPKLAKIMLNLSGVGPNDALLDPFCGSGTVLNSALERGCRDLLGCDLSEKAVLNAQKNADWLIGKLKIKDQKLKIFVSDARKLSTKLPAGSIKAIVTEPFLGQPIKGNEKEGTIKKIAAEVEELYSAAAGEFKKVLQAGGRVVLVVPQWHVAGKIYKFDIATIIKQAGFRRLDSNDLIYGRPEQKVWRQIVIFEK